MASSSSSPSPSTRSLLKLLDIDLPIVQAPMAGVSTPAMAAAVCNAGGLGSIAVGASTPEVAARMIEELQGLTRGAFNVNVFCHRPAVAHAAREAAWIERLRPVFEQLGAAPPARLGEIYRSFVDDAPMLRVLLDARPKVVSFHFGLPPRETISALHRAGIVLFATATSVDEARAVVEAGIDVIVAQGFEAGGHRGTFDPDAPDDALGTVALARVLARRFERPVVAAGGLMDGAGIAAVLRLGAAAAQLGTAFIACDESLADAGFRERLAGPSAFHTVVTRVISGRRARVLANDFSAWGAGVADADVPDYPIAYDAGKALHAAGKASGRSGFGAQWAGQGAPLARSLPAALLVAELARELGEA